MFRVLSTNVNTINHNRWPDDRTNNFLVKPIFGHQKFSSNHSLILDLELLAVSFFYLDENDGEN